MQDHHIAEKVRAAEKVVHLVHHIQLCPASTHSHCVQDPKEPHRWKNSEAQLLFKALMKSGEIKCEVGERMSPSEVWNKFCEPRPEFAGFLFAKFPS
jgi:hypothetical protein